MESNNINNNNNNENDNNENVCVKYQWNGNIMNEIMNNSENNINNI